MLDHGTSSHLLPTRIQDEHRRLPLVDEHARNETQCLKYSGYRNALHRQERGRQTLVEIQLSVGHWMAMKGTASRHG
jgi:hypothetical protein